MRLSISLLLLCMSFLSNGQERLKLIMDTKPMGSVIKVSKYIGDLEVALDSLRYRGEAEVSFPYDNRYTDGVYLLEVSSIESFQFIITKKESLTAHLYESGSGMALKVNMSKENDAFNIMLNLSDVYSQNMDSLSFAMQSLSDFAPRHASVSDSLNQVYHQIADAYNNSLNLLNNLFPNSYTTEVLIPLDKIPLRTQTKDWSKRYDNDAAFNHYHFFEYINFSDERILTNPYLTNKVLEYLYTYTEHSEQGIKKTIDMLLKRDALHPKVQAFMLELLVDFFTDKQAAQFVDYINREYLGSCELPLSEETLSQIENSVKFSPGDQIPNVKIPGETGLEVPVTTMHAKLNVLLFWASWCPHCVRELPKLQTLHQQMNGDLGVYAISVDTSKTDWLIAVRDNNLKWLNVNDLNGWESEHLQTFGITSTPTLILLDSDLRWIGRAASFDGLYDLVKAQLEP